MAKYRIDKVKKLKFARFGGLSSVNQKGYDASMPHYHCPPARRGFYCFVWPFYEMFLLGAPQTQVPFVEGAKFTYIRDGKGNIIGDKHPEYEARMERSLWNESSCDSKEWHDFRTKHNWPDYETTPNGEFARRAKEINEKWDTEYGHFNKQVLVKKPKPRIFEYDGELWHHLAPHLKNGTVLAEQGAWVKSTAYDYREALFREMHDAQKTMQSMVAGAKAENPKCNVGTPASLNKNQSLRFLNKDHLECFIEKL